MILPGMETQLRKVIINLKVCFAVMAMHSWFADIRNEPMKETQRALEGYHFHLIFSYLKLFSFVSYSFKPQFLSSLCRSQDFVREGQLYLVLKTKLIVMSSWDTSLCTVCASPWPASFFYSPPLWLVFVAAKTHAQLFRMGKYATHISFYCYAPVNKFTGLVIFFFF